MLLLRHALRRSWLAPLPIWLLGLLLPATTQAQDIARENFLAERYDVAATIEPASQSLSAVAKVEFRAHDASSIVRVELHPNLNVSSVKDAAGKSLNVDRDQLNPMLVTVNLPSPVILGPGVGRRV